MLDFKPLVYAGRCSTCGTPNRYIVIVSSDEAGKAEAVMQARILRCKTCREKVKASVELNSNAPKAKLSSNRGEDACDLLVGENQKRIIVVYDAYYINIDLNALKKTGFLGKVKITGPGNTESIYHILENEIVPFHFRDEDRDNERIVRREPEAVSVLEESVPERIRVHQGRREVEVIRAGNE